MTLALAGNFKSLAATVSSSSAIKVLSLFQNVDQRTALERFPKPRLLNFMRLEVQVSIGEYDRRSPWGNMRKDAE